MLSNLWPGVAQGSNWVPALFGMVREQENKNGPSLMAFIEKPQEYIHRYSVPWSVSRLTKIQPVKNMFACAYTQFIPLSAIHGNSRIGHPVVHAIHHVYRKYKKHRYAQARQISQDNYNRNFQQE